MRPTMFGSTDAARLVAWTVALGVSLGSMVMAVRTFSVLAGGNSPCGSLAARTEPVLAVAMRYADAGTAGRGRPSCGSRTTMPRLASCGPPTWFLGTGWGPFTNVPILPEAAAGRDPASRAVVRACAGTLAAIA